MDPNEKPAAAATPDAPDQETMEQIRRRRLAKLGGPPASGAPAASSSSGETPPGPGASSSKAAESKAESEEPEKPAPVENRPEINISPAPPPTPQSGTSASSSRPGITISREPRAKRRASEVDGSLATAPPRKQTPLRDETIDDYADRALSSIFRVTVEPGRAADSHGHKLVFLPGLSVDLQGEGGPLRLSVARLEEAIMEAATALPHDRPLFDYLLPCWKRVTRTLKVLRGPAPEKEALLKEARRLCFSNCIFALTVPELFRYAVWLWWGGGPFTWC